mmetsp:Transcript_2315/g.15390  ORF Transcript_2315/g.15390 Transcript_2315/m.15390 type:complete len:87 (+) Transcript_2315:983-1243(+)
MAPVDASVARARRRGTTCVADMASRTCLRVEEGSRRDVDIANVRGDARAVRDDVRVGRTVVHLVQGWNDGICRGALGPSCRAQQLY